MRQWVAALVKLEGTLASALAAQLQVTPATTRVGEVIARGQETATAHREALTSYLQESGGVASEPLVPPVALLAEPAPQPRADAMASALCWDYVASSAAVSGYIVLCELALRLYEPALRDLAPRQLREHGETAQRVGALLVEVVATELADSGLYCHCICPMCSIGACGCVTLGRDLAVAALPRTGIETAAEPGVWLPQPRPGCQLAEAHVQAGDRLVGVDGEPVSSILEVQRAIRNHAIGQSLTLQIQRVSGAVDSVDVTHVGDYPS